MKKLVFSQIKQHFFKYSFRMQFRNTHCNRSVLFFPPDLNLSVFAPKAPFGNSVKHLVKMYPRPLHFPSRSMKHGIARLAAKPLEYIQVCGFHLVLEILQYFRGGIFIFMTHIVWPNSKPLSILP